MRNAWHSVLVFFFFIIVHPVKLILRVQPVQSYNDGAKEYDLSDKLLIQGLQQVVLHEVSRAQNEKAKG